MSRASGKVSAVAVALLSVLLIVGIVLACLVGAVSFSPQEILQSPIFWRLRLPRVLLACVVGAVLSVCGAVYQSVFRNPLTDPYVLGVSSGASLGAVVAILLGWQAAVWGVSGAALCSALFTVGLIYRMATVNNRIHNTTLLLTGVCLTLLISAIISFLMTLHHDKMESIVFWTMGSFSSASWVDLTVVLPVALVGIVIVAVHSRELNLLAVGGDEARSMGVDVERLKVVLLVVTSLMVAFAVSVTGVIGFVGLIVPHAVRIVAGADNRRVVPYSAIIGALFVLLCDTVARTIVRPSELPVGSITSIIGAPLFLYLLLKNKQRR
ncbi:MAG: iron ABC transporter permease [Bacteroidales bacterium]|nr:iron ABC transporter permease [Bacteroidales bacterium]